MVFIIVVVVVATATEAVVAHSDSWSELIIPVFVKYIFRHCLTIDRYLILFYIKFKNF